MKQQPTFKLNYINVILIILIAAFCCDIIYRIVTKQSASNYLTPLLFVFTSVLLWITQGKHILPKERVFNKQQISHRIYIALIVIGINAVLIIGLVYMMFAGIL